MSTLQLTIDGMTCASCVRRVENALKKVPGVTDAQVNLAARRASVEVNNKSMSDTLTDSLVAAVKKVGYESELQDSAAPVSSQQDKSKAEVDALTRQFWMAALLTLPVLLWKWVVT